MQRGDGKDGKLSDIDTNQEGNIDRNESSEWIGSNGRIIRSSFKSQNDGHQYHHQDSTVRRFQRYDAASSTQDTLETMINKYSGDGTRTISSDFSNEGVMRTTNAEETNRCLETQNIYKDPHPQIIRRKAVDTPLTYEQRIRVRFLQPPPLSEPGPLIVKEVRPPQPPAPRPLVIHQRDPCLPIPEPLILRERPPTRPPTPPSETVTRLLPPLPAPPRSAIIERHPPPPEKPRDIIIERWLPYGAPPKRRTIVEPAPPAVSYPEPNNVIVIYENIEARVVHCFENLGVSPENPKAYVARHGASLLDPISLVQQARGLGVTENIDVPITSSSTNIQTFENVAHSSSSGELGNRNTFSSYTTGNERLERVGSSEIVTFDDRGRSYSSTNIGGDYSSTSNIKTHTKCHDDSS